MVSLTTTEWLSKRPKWLQSAAKRLLESGEINETAIGELVVLCQQEANSKFPDIDYSIPTNTFDTHDSEEIRLCSISEIAGVNRLAPKKPLHFGTNNIAVVYGKNSSGKSGYVRLLKHICGARDCIRGQLHKDVFSTKDVVQKAKISFLKNNSPSEHEWSGQGVCDDLRSVDIFDTSFSRVFMGSENEVSYEPPELSFFSRLIDVCEKVAAKLDADKESLKSKMANLPNNLLGSTEADWWGKLSAKTQTDEIDIHCSFTLENETELLDIQKRISEQSPVDKASQLKNKKTYADSIINDVQNYLNQLSDENCKRIIATKKKSILKESASETAAKDAFNGEQLEGIGSNVWKELWNAARKYSEELAYNGQVFPVVQDDSACVLCHQPLSEDAKQRFISFESYIKGETQKQAVQAAKKAKQAIDALPDIPSVEALKTKIDAAGIENQNIIKALTDAVTTLLDRKTKLLSLESEDALTSIEQTPPWLKEIHKISQEYEESAKKYQEDTTKDNREELQKELKNLQTKKWLAEQKTAIQEEVNRLQILERIEKAKKKTSSAVLSKKKGELAKTHITDDFVKRFYNELKCLEASQLNVKLIQPKVSKGKVLYTLQLNGAAHNHLNDVLSEGEYRIVSIAAFLADVTGRNYPAPFVFDDPISSLDQDYEEAVVRRLCQIASKRQVIIFTHRLSLLGMVQDYAKGASIEPTIICIREEPWGTGEPGNTPLYAQRPLQALNTLIERLSQAKNIFNKKGYDAYESEAKSLCIEFRILLERMVEYELMSDVVHRYRRAINTMGKIGNLAKISKKDCTYFDNLMKKYSKYVHSQPLEVPLPLPKPDDLESDFKELKQWQEEFKKRPITPVLQEAQ